MAALVLVATGMLGVLMSSVTQRTWEIGIRMMLGADSSDVARAVAGQALTMTLAGLAIGGGGAFVLTRFMRSLLFGVQQTDLGVGPHRRRATDTSAPLQ